MDQGEKLCEAARSGDSDKLRALIETGADVSYFDGQGLTPLMHAAKHGHAHAVKTLLEAGAPWNALSPSNLSAGDFAMEAGHQDAFDILLSAGTRFAHSFVCLIRKENTEYLGLKLCSIVLNV
jgi:protein arginine N-methyltransferase 2